MTVEVPRLDELGIDAVALGLELPTEVLHQADEPRLLLPGHVLGDVRGHDAADDGDRFESGHPNDEGVIPSGRLV